MAASSDVSALHLPPDLVQRLRARAEQEHCSVEELAADVVTAFLEDAEWERDIRQARQSIAAGRGIPFDEVAATLRGKAARIAGR